MSVYTIKLTRRATPLQCIHLSQLVKPDPRVLDELARRANGAYKSQVVPVHRVIYYSSVFLCTVYGSIRYQDDKKERWLYALKTVRTID